MSPNFSNYIVLDLTLKPRLVFRADGKTRDSVEDLGADLLYSAYSRYLLVSLQSFTPYNIFV